MSHEPNNPLAATLATDLRLLVGKMKRRLREQSDLGDLSWSQTSVLSHLERNGPATVTALAKAEGVRPQSMGATVAGLEAAGMIVGSPHPTDGRQTILSLTDACRDWIVAGRAARQDWLSHTIEARLSPAEQSLVAEAVVLLQRLAEP